MLLFVFFLAHCCSLRIASLCRVFARFAMNWEVEAGTSIILRLPKDTRRRGLWFGRHSESP